jgi:hypothetical protein
VSTDGDVAAPADVDADVDVDAPGVWSAAGD